MTPLQALILFEAIFLPIMAVVYLVRRRQQGQLDWIRDLRGVALAALPPIVLLAAVAGPLPALQLLIPVMIFTLGLVLLHQGQIVAARIVAAGAFGVAALMIIQLVIITLGRTH